MSWPRERVMLRFRFINIKKHLTCTKGFTLLEVVVAVSILTVGLLAIATLQGAAIRGNNHASTSTVAATVATDRVEKLLALSSDSVLLNDTDGDGTAGLSDIGVDADHATTEQMNGATFSVFWNVAPDTPNSGNKTIGLIVEWNDRGRTRYMELTQIR
ncbi:MAG: hypothetical protein DRH12_05680 [Deltaproteobacteria bacterium]|nr:MAG: hypothetical protein DRH12_05680 [Deltaproteobacteria bacterium]